MTATSTIAATDFMVDRKDLRSSRFSAASLPAAPAPGEVLLAIDTFALTANNITYAAFGDAMQYWGAQVLRQRIADAWRAFMAPVCDPARGWLHVIEGHGPAAVERVYLDLLDGKTRPDQGHILSLASPA